MNIVYGVCGEGYGHSSRALTIADYLEKKGHNIIIITYGRAYKVLKKRFKTFKVRGLELITRKGVLHKTKTFFYNLRSFPQNFYKINRIKRLIKTFKPELYISDMEPIVPILRYWYSKPMISFDNQHRLTNLRFSVPKRYYQDYLIAKNVVSTIVGRANHYIITSYVRLPARVKNTTIVPPLIREQVRKLKPRINSKVLIYLTQKNPRVLRILKKIPEKFVVFGYNRNKKKGNLEFKKPEHFLKELKDCKAIIGTAGYTLISEAIYLKKPYLAIPIQGQFEQALNALFLKKSGYGDYSDEFDEGVVERFLKNLGKYKKKLERYRYDDRPIYRTFDRVIEKIMKDKAKQNI